MAYVGVSNVTVANGAGTYLYTLKESLKLALWDVLSSTNGGSFSGGDNLPTAASFAVAGAWARVREPGGVGKREYILQNGTLNGVNAIIKYSRADGFTGGSPSATVAPTTGGGDGIVMVGTGTDASPVSNVLANATGYVSAVASDTASPGVYGCFAWYLVGYTVAPVASVRVALTEAVAPGSTSSLDQDPTWRFGSSQGATFGTAAQQLNPQQLGTWWIGPDVTGIGFWQAYGLAGEVYNTGGQTGIPIARNASSTTQVVYPIGAFTSVSPYDGREPMYPLLVGQAGLTTTPAVPARIAKGYTTGVATFAATHNLLDTFNLNTSDPKIAISLASGTLVSVAMPWLTNVIPTV
jgi:hypothetical protein